MTASDIRTVSTFLHGLLAAEFERLETHLASHESGLVVAGSRRLREEIREHRAQTSLVKAAPALFSEHREGMVVTAMRVEDYMHRHEEDDVFPEGVAAEVAALLPALRTLSAFPVM